MRFFIIFIVLLTLFGCGISNKTALYCMEICEKHDGLGLMTGSGEEVICICNDKTQIRGKY